MVEGYCIYGGWMLAAAMDVVFAASDAQFLGGLVEYMSIPWDLGVRRAKELSFESRFISAAEAYEYGFLNRVLPPRELEAETLAYARRVAENSALYLRVAKQMINRAQDLQGFTDAVEGGLTEFVAMVNVPGQDAVKLDASGRRLEVVNLALRGRRGERPGQTPRLRS
jgi:enoyl-CoA hydratase